MTMTSCDKAFGGLARRRFWAGMALAAGILIGGHAQATQLFMGAIPSEANPTFSPGDTNVTTTVSFSIKAANADPRYSFSHWLLLDCTNSSPVTTTNNATTTIRVNIGAAEAYAYAVYIANTYTLTVSASPASGGSTDPAGVNTYLKGDKPSVSAFPTNLPVPGYEFAGWVGSAPAPSLVNPLEVDMQANKTLTANFAKLWNISQTFRLGPADATPFLYRLRDQTYTNVTVPSAVAEQIGARRYRCDGWTAGTGSVIPTSRSGAAATSCNLSPLNANSALSWVWMPQFRVDASNTPQGYMTIEELASPGDNDGGDRWADSNTTIRVTVVPNDVSKFEPDYVLVGGVRQDLGPTYQVDLLVTGPMTLVPVFRVSSQDDPGFISYMKRYGLVAGAVGQRTFDDPDEDGLDNLTEFRLASTNGAAAYYYNPINADTDGDGMDDAYEKNSIDPTNLSANARNTYRPAATDNGDGSVDNGPEGNPDEDYHWNTADGYMQYGQPLANTNEYCGPDGVPPWTSVVLNFGESYVDVNGVTHNYPFASNPSGSRPAVRIRVPVAGDTGDQSRANTIYSDRDAFDDGFEYSWDQWQRTHSLSDEAFLVGVSNGLPSYITNTVPNWSNSTTRVFNPGRIATVSDGPDYDILYDYNSGKVSLFYYSAEREYNAWKENAFSPTVAGAPHSIRMDAPPPSPDGALPHRCSHPFLWDVDQDGVPDGYEVIFGYDPWSPFTSGATGTDGEDNPDNDWMAKSTNSPLSLRNHEVYLANGFNPRVAVDEVYPVAKDMVGKGTKRSPSTFKFSNSDEMRGPDGMMALAPSVPGSGADDATSPFRSDSDGDGIWDGWECYVGMDPNLDTDVAIDSDDDKVSNLDEFRSFYTSSTNRAALTPLLEWRNKIFPTDPGVDPSPRDNNPLDRDNYTHGGKDTDADGISDGTEKTLFNADAYGGIITSYVTITFDENGNEVETTVLVGYGLWATACYVGGGLNPTSADTDDDTLPDPYEGAYASGLDGTAGDTFDDPDGDGLENYQEYWGASVYHWQYDVWVNSLPSYDNADFFSATPKTWDWSTQWRYIPLTHFDYVKRFSYAGPDPTRVDSDDDAMDDYYEIYHGLNPIYGALDLIASRAAKGAKTTSSTGSVGDPRDQPWKAGSVGMDPDADGLLNFQEAPYSEYPEQSPRIHTDPSSLWMTDTGYDRSWVNLYYRPSSVVWYWRDDLTAPPPDYAFSFESNEGYDTDNDGVGDKEELNVTKTDPLTPERPVKRRALYLPPGPNTYARTYPGYAPQLADAGGGYMPGIDVVRIADDAMRSFTVEAWVRPINPDTGTDQVIVERPLMIPSGNEWRLAPGIRLNFRLAIGGDGKPYVTYTGEGYEPIHGDPKLTGSAVLSTNWTHLAATYQVSSATDPQQGGILTFYVNGTIAARSHFDQLPATGAFDLSGSYVRLLGAPIVVGAADRNPDGEFGGIVNQPDPYLFFKGWIDEVRIWNGARSEGDVRSGMNQQMRQTDVLAQQSSAATLKYLYTFDGMPDPVGSATGDGTPLGFDETATKHFPPGWVATFWDATPQRSQVYTDTRYVPWIENIATHVPTNFPCDIGDTNLLKIVMSGTNVIGRVPNFWNTSNPYGVRYFTSEGSRFQRTEQYNDLLPLGLAQAFEPSVRPAGDQIPMWDNGTLPVAQPNGELGDDSDGDGMSDFWEELYGLDPLSKVGADGAFADLDGDGLANLYEFAAKTDPGSFDTLGNGFSDFYAWDPDPTHTNRYRQYGELYTDHDGMEDAWELANGLDPRRYDAHLDLDGDGWSNLAEFQEGTGPNDRTKYPQPSVAFRIRCGGFGSDDPRNVIIHFYSTPTMDGVPDAVAVPSTIDNFSMFERLPMNSVGGFLAQRGIEPGSVYIDINGGYDPYYYYWWWWYYGYNVHDRYEDGNLHGPWGPAGTINYQTGAYTLTHPGASSSPVVRYRYRSIPSSYPVDLEFSQYQSGHLLEGDAYFFAFSDRNGNRSWDEGEPAGVAQYQPINIRRGTNDVEIGLTDTLPGYQRFSWPAQSGQTAYPVKILNMSMSGTVEAQFSIQAPRTYVHEQDYRNVGIRGLPFAPSYAAVVLAADGTTVIATTNFNVSYYPDSPAQPVTVYPKDDTLYHARNEFVWRMDTNATQFNLVIKPGSISNPSVLDVTTVPTFREADGTTHYRLPIYAGDGLFTNGVYYWQVTSLNRRANAASAWEQFTVNLDDYSQGPWSISGDVVYAGKVTNRNFVVQAYPSPGFGGVPVAQVTVSNAVVPAGWPLNRMVYALKGLPQGSFYLRAFLDQNMNQKPDIWESSGFLTDPGSFYSPGSVAVPVSARERDVFVTVADTDNDKLADDWEYRYYENLETAGPGPLGGYTASAIPGINVYEAYAATELNMSPVDPNVVGPDGLPLRLKSAFGLNVWGAYDFVISGMRADAGGNPQVSWPALSKLGVVTLNTGGAVSMSSGGMTLHYQLQYTEDLATWNDITTQGVVLYESATGQFRFSDESVTSTALRFYRYRVWWE